MQDKRKYKLHSDDCYILSNAIEDVTTLMNMETVKMSTIEELKMYNSRYENIKDLYKRCGCK